ncbi:hypothetical protein ACWGFX_06650 [Streptomyces xanthophaeus]
MSITRKYLRRGFALAVATASVFAFNAPTASAHDTCSTAVWDCEYHWGGNTIQVQNSHNSPGFQSWIWVNDESADGRGAFATVHLSNGGTDRRPWDNDGAHNNGASKTFGSDVYRFQLCEEGSGQPDACSSWIYLKYNTNG